MNSIVKNSKEFDVLKDMLAQDNHGKEVIFIDDTPTEYPCLVKWVEEDAIEFGDSGFEADDFDDLEDLTETEIVGTDFTSGNEVAIVKFIFIYKSEVEALVAL